MSLKILLTGKNRKIIKDVGEHLESDKGYTTVKCDPTKTALFELTLSELPKVIIICLGDETSETVKVYNVMKNIVRQGNCVVIVIANHEDEKFFVKYTELRRVLFLSRPVSLFALYEKLSEIEEKMKKDKENNLSAFREFINYEAEKRDRKKHVLVVDDDTEQLILLREQLEEFYDVTPVKSGEAAFKYLLKHTTDIILLDYLMPEMDGPDVIRKLRTIEEYAEIPVVFLTGMTEKSAVLKTLIELQPQGYIVKPAKKSELVAKIIDVLG